MVEDEGGGGIRVGGGVWCMVVMGGGDGNLWYWIFVLNTSIKVQLKIVSCVKKWWLSCLTHKNMRKHHIR